MKITTEGRNKIEQQLLQLQEKFVGLQKEKAKAYTLTGDTWHDNPYFDMLRRDEEAVVKEIEALTGFLQDAELVESTGSIGNTVNIGTKIRCEIRYSFDDESEETVIEIVGHGESNPADGKIAYDSPVGANLMGHEEGDTVNFTVPAGEVSYKLQAFLDRDIR